MDERPFAAAPVSVCAALAILSIGKEINFTD
jgi:hypothetical protein